LSFRDAKLCFLDIFEAIEMIEQFTAGMNFEDFRTDPKTIAAVERKLQVISEAATRVGPNARRTTLGCHGAISAVSVTGCATNMSE
jgi:uncharacterized protein with HEPN domain